MQKILTQCNRQVGCNIVLVVLAVFVKINYACTHIYPDVGNVMRSGLHHEELSIIGDSALG